MNDFIVTKSQFSIFNCNQYTTKTVEFLNKICKQHYFKDRQQNIEDKWFLFVLNYILLLLLMLKYVKNITKG